MSNPVVLEKTDELMADLFLEVIVPNEKLYEFLEDDKLLD
jgi:N utilization substance protein B